jgi:hypothetical protein
MRSAEFKAAISRSLSEGPHTLMTELDFEGLIRDRITYHRDDARNASFIAAGRRLGFIRSQHSILAQVPQWQPAAQRQNTTNAMMSLGQRRAIGRPR